MVDYYERFVKEYLELQGYYVRVGTKFMKGNWSDIDVIAIHPRTGQAIVGEVKSTSPNLKEIDEEWNDFNDTSLQAKIAEVLGHQNYDRYLFVWPVDDDIVKYAQDKYQIKVIQFWEMINFMLNVVKERLDKDSYIYEAGIEFPNLMLLQMIAHFSKEYKGKKRVDLNQFL
jgi:hypothetical protein